MSIDVASRVTEAEQALGITFNKKSVLLEALTHPSYSAEHPQHSTIDQGRLEFLGDSVLQLVVTEYLMEAFPHYREGKLTKYREGLVNNRFLARVAREMKLDHLPLLGAGALREARWENETPLRIASCLLEALIGAIHQDQGPKASRRFIEVIILDYLSEVLSAHEDIVSLVRHEALHHFQTEHPFRFRGEAPRGRKGKTISYDCVIAGVRISTGRGSRKASAIHYAATQALGRRRQWASMIEAARRQEAAGQSYAHPSQVVYDSCAE